MPPRFETIGIDGIPEVRPGDAVADLVHAAAARQGTPFAAGDVLVVGQKIVSKAEGRLVRLGDVTPSAIAAAMARELGRDARLVEVILRESRRVVRMDKGVLIAETHHGWICANAGVDQSNVELDTVVLLPEDPDRSARQLRERIRALAGVDVAVLIADTFGLNRQQGRPECEGEQSHHDYGKCAAACKMDESALDFFKPARSEIRKDQCPEEGKDHQKRLEHKHHSVLKESIQRWLCTRRMSRHVIAYTSARRCDGGGGAVYVLLRE